MTVIGHDLTQRIAGAVLALEAGDGGRRGDLADALVEVDALITAHQGAVERVNAALRIVEDHRDGRGNVQMGRGFASQVVELLRAAGGSRR